MIAGHPAPKCCRPGTEPIAMRNMQTAALFTLLAFTAAPSLGQDEDAAKKGEQFVQLLIDGKFDEAAAMFDETMHAAIPVDKLRQSWDQLAATHGPFRSKGEAIVAPYLQYKLVFVPCRWERGRLRAKVVFDVKGRVAGLFFEPDPSAPPAQPKSPVIKPVAEREVTVGRGEWALPATFSTPLDGPIRAGVVFVHGSGPNDRDESIGPNKPFRDIAWGLGPKGIAALRYDKRTKVHGAKYLSRAITVDEEVVDDALLALDALRALPEMKNKPIFLIGHSLGAMLAPEIAVRDGRLDGVVLLAGVARPFEDVVVDQFKYIGSLKKRDGAKERLAVIQAKMDAVRNKTLDPKENVMGAPASYWYDICGRDAEVILDHARSLECRILVLQGARDYQAKVEDFELFRAALKDHPNAEFKLFRFLNHIFARGRGKAVPGEYGRDIPVDPPVIELIAEWCLRGK